MLNCPGAKWGAALESSDSSVIVSRVSLSARRTRKNRGIIGSPVGIRFGAGNHRVYQPGGENNFVTRIQKTLTLPSPLE